MRTNLIHRPSLVSLAGAVLATAAVSSASTAMATGTAEEAGPAARLFRLPDALAEDVAGAVFTMTNSADPDRGNEVVAFNRLEDGSLVVAGYFPTGGLGAGPAPTSTVFGAPVPATADSLGSQGSLILTDKRGDNPRRLFAVNAGSNSITCFRVETDESGTTLSAPRTVDSGGVFPVSLTFRRTGGGGGVLYVLNSGEGGNITGFRVSGDCGLAPLPGGQRSLEGLVDDPPFPEPAPNEVLTTAAQVAFTPSGSELVVSIKGGPAAGGGGFEGGVVVFQTSRSSGLLRSEPPAVTEFSADADRAGPFGFTFDENGNLVLNHVNSFTVAAYRIEDSGALTPIGGPIPISGPEAGLGDDSVLSFGGFNCWIVRRGNIVYVMTFGDIPATSGGLPDGPGVISALEIANNGSLSLLEAADEFGVDGVVAVLPQDDRDAFPDDPTAEVFGNHGIDLTIVENGDQAFLYAIEPRLGQIGAWEIEADGTLTPVSNFNGGLPPGVDPFAGTNPGINDFLERCFLQDEPRSPECAQGSAQGIVGF